MEHGQPEAAERQDDGPFGPSGATLTLAKHERIPFDAYQTDPKLCSFLVQQLLAQGFAEILPEGLPSVHALEPSAGDGNFVRAMRAGLGSAWCIEAVDIHADADRLSTAGADVVTKADFLDYSKKVRCCYDLVVGNPPYKGAEEHVRAALDVLRPGGVLAFLLRLAFVESKQRYPLMRGWPPAKIYALAERPSFTGGKTDSAAYGFFVWRRGCDRRTEMEVVSWK